MYEQALAGNEKVLGLEYLSILDTVSNLETLYKDSGQVWEGKGDV